MVGYLYLPVIGDNQLLSLKNYTSIIDVFTKIRFNFATSLEKVLPQPEASLATALVVGTKAGFPTDLKKQFINTGTIHLVAVSGFNITIMLKLFSNWLKPLGRHLAFILGTVVIVAFILITGGQASIVRAGIMGWLFILARYIFRMPNIKNALFVTAFLMVIQEPSILLSDIGFQLSFVAMLGLIYLSPIIDYYLPKNIPKFIRSVLVETLSAQIAVTPLIAGHFQRISTISLLPNLLILPMITGPMVMAIVIGLCQLVVGKLIVIISIPLYFSLKYILFVISIFNGFAYKNINLNGANWIYVLIVYSACIMAIVFLGKRTYYEKN